MDKNRKRQGDNWGRLASWVIFFLIVAGGPVLRLIGQLFNGTVALPPMIGPIIVGAAVLLTVLIGMIGVAGAKRSRGDTRLPMGSGSSSRPPNAPMPPFGNSPSSDSSLSRSLPPSFNQPAQGSAQGPRPLRFDPVINPTILAISVVGLFLLVGVGLFVIAQRVP